MRKCKHVGFESDEGWACIKCSVHLTNPIRKEKSMFYHIEVKNSRGEWERIASFQNMIDRDDCESFLADKYEDCTFRTKDSN